MVVWLSEPLQSWGLVQHLPPTCPCIALGTVVGYCQCPVPHMKSLSCLCTEIRASFQLGSVVWRDYLSSPRQESDLGCWKSFEVLVFTAAK